MTLPTKILTAAMASKHHVFVNWSPHVKWLRVYAFPSDTDYQSDVDDRVFLIDDCAKADDSAGLARLLERIEELDRD